MKLLVTRYPFVFWFLRENENEFNINFDENKLTNLKGEVFAIKSLPKVTFLLFKYVPILLIFGWTFNKYDFYLLDKMKIMQYAVALILASIVFFAKKPVIYASFILFLAGGFFYLESVPLQRNNNTLTHIIILEQENE